jgi:hypothetical protein
VVSGHSEPAAAPRRPLRLQRHAYGWITLIMFGGAFGAHFSLAMLNGDPVSKWAQDFFENIQSEAAQLLWQVCGLAWFLQVGSPASKDGSERLEAKVDQLLINTVRNGDEIVQILDDVHLRK